MSRELRAWLQDIASSCTKITRWSGEITFADFASRDRDYSAILRELAVVGEAVKQLPDDFREEYQQIPWRAIAGFRDVLVHGYFGVRDETVWDAAINLVPVLAQFVDDQLELIPSNE